MGIIRAPRMPPFISDRPSDPTMYVGWFLADEMRHIAAQFPPPELLRNVRLNHQTACGLKLESGTLDKIKQPCTEIPSDMCPGCRTWVETDLQQQAAHPPEVLVCCVHGCTKRAKHVRHTQFSGNHSFCDMHARKEEDFGGDDPSYFFWEELTEVGGTEFERYKSVWGAR